MKPDLTTIKREKVEIEPRKPLTRRDIGALLARDPTGCLPYELVAALVDYDPGTGAFTWRRRPVEMFAKAYEAWVWNKKFAGKAAFTALNAQGYRTGRLYGRRIKAHCVAWLLVHRVWPEDLLDHIDHCRTNNAIANLRAADSRINARNASLRKDNTSGVTGVHWHAVNKKWRAQISVGGRLIHLGMFTRLADAISVRRAAQVEHGFSPNHGAAPQ